MDLHEAWFHMCFGAFFDMPSKDAHLFLGEIDIGTHKMVVVPPIYAFTVRNQAGTSSGRFNGSWREHSMALRVNGGCARGLMCVRSGNFRTDSKPVSMHCDPCSDEEPNIFYRVLFGLVQVGAEMIY